MQGGAYICIRHFAGVRWWARARSSHENRRRHNSCAITTFPRLADTSHRRCHVSRPFSPVLLYFTTLIHSSALPRTSSDTAFSTRSPVRRCANICHIVIFRRPYTFPHRLRCVLLILFHIYLAFMFQNMLSILCHMFTYILHTNYDTQSSYKTVELLCTTE